jgi:hypothetical protein
MGKGITGGGAGIPIVSEAGVQAGGSLRRTEDIAALIHETRDPKTVGEKVRPLGKQGRPTKEEQEKGNGVTFNRGNSKEYRAAKIARDAPKVWERMKAGEFSTVAEAERAAHIKGVPDRRVWLSANPEEAAEKLSVNFSRFEMFEFYQMSSKSGQRSEMLGGCRDHPLHPSLWPYSQYIWLPV